MVNFVRDGYGHTHTPAGRACMRPSVAPERTGLQHMQAAALYESPFREDVEEGAGQCEKQHRRPGRRGQRWPLCACIWP